MACFHEHVSNGAIATLQLTIAFLLAVGICRADSCHCKSCSDSLLHFSQDVGWKGVFVFVGTPAWQTCSIGTRFCGTADIVLEAPAQLAKR